VKLPLSRLYSQVVSKGSHKVWSVDLSAVIQEAMNNLNRSLRRLRSAGSKE
jgi:hypothetical protein